MDRLRLWPPFHAMASATSLIGMRDRMRCPMCRAVGTYKPHGSIVGRIFQKDRPVRRWLCKWCGFYVGPEGVMRAFSSKERGCWVLPYPWTDDSPKDPLPTPADLVTEQMNLWPWYG